MARILIVDDDPVFGRLTQRRLERAGHAVALREGPLGTLTELKKGSFDLLVLDLRMPALSGADIVRMVHARSSGTRGTKIVLYSNVEQDTLASLASSLGVEGHAPKSAPFTQLVGVIESVLAREAAVHGGGGERGRGAANPAR